MLEPNAGYSLRRRISVAAAVSIFALCDTAIAKDWVQYENAYFVAYSSAGSGRTKKLLSELELFRAAVAQVANLHVPDDAPKTIVVIFGGKKEFNELMGTRKIGGFARQRANGEFLIVMPTVRDFDYNNETIRHEFAHVLLGWSEFSFPQWFDEGFAELVSTIRFRRKNTAFTFGEAPSNFFTSKHDNLDWNALIEDGFKIQGLRSIDVARAYSQCWLLTHYLMLGNEFENTPKLMHYFSLIGGGDPSLPAFELAIGEDANALWHSELNTYAKRLFYVTYDFRPGIVQASFTPVPNDQEALRSVVEEKLQIGQ